MSLSKKYLIQTQTIATNLPMTRNPTAKSEKLLFHHRRHRSFSLGAPVLPFPSKTASKSALAPSLLGFHASLGQHFRTKNMNGDGSSFSIGGKKYCVLWGSKLGSDLRPLQVTIRASSSLFVKQRGKLHCQISSEEED